ncbi:chemotaxis protein [Rossellomorea marisflavi]|nr:chemotaxis protein [Rossellomorea marisflavi]MCM2590415.1 chemotaxis protein [Rossellomorea marisflavi]UTE71279.1 chemotaxis protein [Rossellomorea marisflavi]
MINDQHSILLESGTNELEIIEFEIEKRKFGINVIKVKEIILPTAVIPVPHSHPHVEGLIQLRGEVLPLINLGKVLGRTGNPPPEAKYIVAEFNQQKVVFHVHNVTQIHRISWNDIEKPTSMYQGGDQSTIIGVIKRTEDMILLLDFESILLEINPQTGIRVEEVKKLGHRERSDKQIVAAEDSPLLRKLLHDTLSEGGYGQVEFFENGADALAYLESLADQGGNVTDQVQLIITDIEMPQMDGHHLTRRIKSDQRLKDLPVIIFSSLITNDLKHKGHMVGAEDQISKPEISELIKTIDKYIL